MPNRLAQETSPYLLQHAENPVDWYPWGEEALTRAKVEQRPIFLSIGYSACHWCHVMEHESFEDPQIAEEMNRRFVCVKVDREERPDLDQIYMNAVQLMTGAGGWPMSVFLTPELEPFFGGTYWPPRRAMGRPGFQEVLLAVDDAWQNRRADAVAQARTLTEHLGRVGVPDAGSAELRPELLSLATRRLEGAFDTTYGGFGTAPKFPHPMDLQLLVAVWRRDPQPGTLRMVTETLDKMADGGIYDHLGGGFARYSVDARWLVPHFEKMLYDNALLAQAYLDGWLATQNPRYRRIVEEINDYILGEMTDPAGGFHSTEDADSEGEEGKFYVWTPDEVETLLGAQTAALFCQRYGVSAAGNFEGRNILHLNESWEAFVHRIGEDEGTLRETLQQARQTLLQARSQRIRPGKDDKVLVSWNALMISALARSGQAFPNQRYLAAAEKAARFLRETLRRSDGRLLHCWRQGRARFDAYLDDYAYLVNALVDLYEATGRGDWLSWGDELAEIMLARFRDSHAGGFYFTADDHEQLITRNKDFFDASVPSGNAMAATALLRLGKLTGKSSLREAARGTLQVAASLMENSMHAGQMFLALDLLLGPCYEIAIVGDDAAAIDSLVHRLRSRLRPQHVLATHVDGQSIPSPLAMLLEGKRPLDGQVTAYICRDFACEAPIVGPDAIAAAWEQLDGRGSV